MKIKTTFTIVFASISFFLFAQDNNSLSIDTILDKRDGKSYEIIQIGNTKWFRDNLKFETKGSFCPNIKNKDKDCGDGNFYPYAEIDTICPTGWRIPRVKDWEQYYHFVRNQKGIGLDDIKHDTLLIPELSETVNNSIIVTDLTKTMKLFDPSNLLKLSALGWVEGRRRRKIGTITLWAKTKKLMTQDITCISVLIGM